MTLSARDIPMTDWSLEAVSDEPDPVVMLESLLEHLADGVLAVGRDGCIGYWSPSLARLTGVTGEQALGRAAADLLGELAPAPRGGAGGEASGSVQFPTGEIPLRIVSVRASGPAGITLGHVAAVTDLRREYARRSAREQGEALARLGAALATAAHQLRNPLGASLGFLGLLEQDLAGTQAAGLCARVREGLLEIDRRIGELLCYARPRPPVFQATDIAGLLRAVAEEASARFGGRPPIAARVPARLMLRADAGQLRQAIENLIVNAAQAAGPDGRVRVLLRPAARTGLEPPVAARSGLEQALPARAIRLLVRNTGSAIEPGELTQLFEPFVTRRAGGTGLGLPLARRIVVAHNGTIQALSAGGWTTFVVTLPCDPTREMKETP